MIMMPYGCPWPSPQLTRHADFWHPTGPECLPATTICTQQRIAAAVSSAATGLIGEPAQLN